MRIHLLLAALAALYSVSDAALAAMSIDLGAQYIKLALVKPGVPMEIVLNKESRRKTPNLLGIRNEERFFADAAAQLALKFPKNTYPYLLNLIAKKDGDPAATLYRQQFPFAAVSATDRNTVKFPADDKIYDVETLIAMILWSAKKTTEAYAEQTVKDAIITVPAFFNQAERRAIATAAEIAGINLLQIMSHGSAAALNYGVFRRKEITEQAQTMLIYDMGAAKTEVSVVEYQLVESKDKRDKNPTIRTIGYGFDRTLGGLEMTLRVQKHLEEAFRKQHKTPTDIATNPRAMAKLHKEAERVKQVLSANINTFAQIENVHEDTNFRTEVTREDFEKMIEDLDARVKAPIADALKMAELDISQIEKVVLMGAGTRVPRVKTLLASVMGDKELGNFLNTDEAIALGSVYQSARLSNSFKVLPFDILEAQLYPVQVDFQSVDEAGNPKAVSKTLFNYRTHFPAPKKIVTFTSYSDDFEFALNYGKLDHLSQQQIKEFGSQQLLKIGVSDVKEKMAEAMAADNSTFKGFKIHVGVDASGIVSLHKVELNVEQPPPPVVEEPAVEEPAPVEDAKKTDENKTAEEPAAEEKKAETDETKEGDKEEETKDESKKNETKKEEEKVEKKKEEPKPKKIKVTMPIKMEELDVVMLNSEEIKAAKEILAAFKVVENAKHEREEAMNRLESMLYDLHDKLELGEGVVEFMNDEEKEKLREQVTALRTWQEDEAGFDTTTAEFKEKIALIEDLTKAARARNAEYLAFPKLEADLLSLFNHSESFLASSANLTKKDDEDDIGIYTATEIETLQKKYDETKAWYDEKKAAKEAQKKYEDPAITAVSIDEKGAELQREVKYLFNKLMNYKPKVKKDETKDNETNTETKDETKTEEETTTDKAEDETTHDASDL